MARIRDRDSRATRIVELDVIGDPDSWDDGPGWSTLSDASDRHCVRLVAMLLAGNESAKAVVRIVAVDDDRQIHFPVLPGSVAKSRHRLDQTAA